MRKTDMMKEKTAEKVKAKMKKRDIRTKTLDRNPLKSMSKKTSKMMKKKRRRILVTIKNHKTRISKIMRKSMMKMTIKMNSKKRKKKRTTEKEMMKTMMKWLSLMKNRSDNIFFTSNINKC